MNRYFTIALAVFGGFIASNLLNSVGVIGIFDQSNGGGLYHRQALNKSLNFAHANEFANLKFYRSYEAAYKPTIKTVLSEKSQSYDADEFASIGSGHKTVAAHSNNFKFAMEFDSINISPKLRDKQPIHLVENTVEKPAFSPSELSALQYQLAYEFENIRSHFQASPLLSLSTSPKFDFDNEFKDPYQTPKKNWEFEGVDTKRAAFK